MLRRSVVLTSLFCAILFVGGCGAFDRVTYTPSYVLSFYQHVEYFGLVEVAEDELIDEVTGKSYWVNKNQFFDSRTIEAVKILPIEGNPNYVNLAFKLDKAGASRWVSLLGSSSGSSVVVTIDGKFYDCFLQKLDVLEDKTTWVKCAAKFDMLTARGIVEYAPKNYKYYSPKATSWF